QPPNVDPAEQQSRHVGEAVPLHGDRAELQRDRIDVREGNCEEAREETHRLPAVRRTWTRRAINLAARRDVGGTAWLLSTRCADMLARAGTATHSDMQPIPPHHKWRLIHDPDHRPIFRRAGEDDD